MTCSYAEDSNVLLKSKFLLESILPHVLKSADYSVEAKSEKKIDKLVVKIAPTDFEYIRKNSGLLLTNIQSMLNEYYLSEKSQESNSEENLKTLNLTDMVFKDPKALVVIFEKKQK
jgi:hypothetical protein